MKSPTISVGIIDPEGILKGSNRNERSMNTARITGKKLFGYSTHQGSFSPIVRFLLNTRMSSSQIPPVTTSRINMINAKSIFLPESLIVDLQHGQEGFLGNLDVAHLFHAFLAGLLLFQKLALSADVAAITFG